MAKATLIRHEDAKAALGMIGAYVNRRPYKGRKISSVAAGRARALVKAYKRQLQRQTMDLLAAL